MSNTIFLQEPEPLDREQSIESYLKSRLRSLDSAIAGYTELSLQGLSGNVDLTPSQAKHRAIKLTGAPSGAVTVRIPATTGANCDIIFDNACTGTYKNVTIKSTGANAGNSGGVAAPSGFALKARHDGESAYPVGTPINKSGETSPPVPSWTAVTYQNSWVDFGSTFSGVKYTKINGVVVFLKGICKNGTATAGTVVFNLPAGFRPAEDRQFATVSNNIFGNVKLLSNGDMVIQVASNVWLSFDGLSFPAEA